ncbi:MAG: hypothetical protein J7L15_06220 [Clostridiales bacterium]|nr:hypothetical protein [Clostridiales bacterium]
MKIDEINEYIRSMFIKLINNGFTKSSISEITLGRSFTPQFTKFIEQTDLGLKPITRMIEGLGYDIHIVPIKSEDVKNQKYIEQIMTDFYQNSNSEILDYLDNSQCTVSTPIKINKTYQLIIDELCQNII